MNIQSTVKERKIKPKAIIERTTTLMFGLLLI